VLAADGQRGVFVVWDDERAASGTRDIYAQHVTKDGTLFEGWPDQGLPVCTAPEEQGGASIVSDGELGAIVGWGDLRSGRRSAYAIRFGPGGSTLPAAGWPVDGAPVCTATQLQCAHEIAPDLAGGVFVAWEDYRSRVGDIYVQRVMSDGSVAPGWPMNGLRASAWPGYEGQPHLAPDGAGGCYLVYEDLSNYLVYCQHVSGAGELRWGANGLLVSPVPTYGQQYASIAADGRGGAIVAWEETRAGPSSYDVYAQRIGLDGPTGVLVSLVGIETEPDRVRLSWHGPDAAGMAAVVYRRSDATEWEKRGEIMADASGRLVYEDRDVRPGARYAYKLGYRDSASESFTPETWVTLPYEFRLALGGLRPNPASSELNVAFTLGQSAPASLEVLDLGGRRIVSRDVGGMGPGRHVLRLWETRALSPGVYWIRLQQAGQSAVTKGVITR
jgi:hypothetical protein